MKSIKWRLVILYVLLVMIVMIVSGTFIVISVEKNSDKNIYKELKAAANYITETINLSQNLSKEELKNELISTIKKKGSLFKDKKLYLLDSQGNVIYPELEDNKHIHGVLNSRVILYAKTGKINNGIYKNPGYNENNVLIEMADYAEPIIFNNEVSFILYIKTPLQPVKENLNNTKLVIVTAVVLAIILSGLLGFFFSNNITNPIIALTGKAREIANGDLSQNVYSIEVYSNDEIGTLTESFNYMAKELNKTLSQITSEKSKLETVFTHMADGILVFDKNGKLIHANPAANKMLGIYMSKRNFNKMFSQLDNKMDFDKLLKLEKNSIYTYMLYVKEKFINACFATYIDKINESVGLITVLQDITEQKKLEEMQKEFVANVSHELRTPITTIKSYAETLLDGAIDEKEIAVNFLNVINHESDRMTTLVQDLLELSKLDNKQIKFDMKRMDLTKVLEECINKYKIHSNKKSQIMTYYKPNKKYMIIGDLNRVEQGIRNIISNAVKYSPEGAKINIEVKEEDNFIKVSISDTGMGIPKEDLPRIFERFYRVDKARSRAMGGTGLGLAIVKEIMECHGGKIQVESQYGKGTTFFLDFPTIC